ncbi:MAG: hypothetical protein QG646_2338 [Euryarchaeota archaeon]|nr:hypothetical protein [Euryarchaeota archaeon]
MKTNPFAAGHAPVVPIVLYYFFTFLLSFNPNNDGLYEDINGNGRLDFDDVVVYFNNMIWITQKGLIAYFDYNHNSRIDFNDVVLLFNMH